MARDGGGREGSKGEERVKVEGVKQSWTAL